MAYNQFSPPFQSQPNRAQVQGQPPHNGRPGGGGQYVEGGRFQQPIPAPRGNRQQEGRPPGQNNGYIEPPRGGVPHRPAPQPTQQPNGYRPHQLQRPDQPPYIQQGHSGQVQHSTGPPITHRDRGERQGRERHRPPELDRSTKAISKARERILPAVESPVVVAWDNPFPVFSAKKKDAKKGSSLEKDASKTNLSSPPESRPQTSQGHGTSEQVRPQTSSGHRSPDTPVTSPGPHSAHPTSPKSLPMSPSNDNQNRVQSPRSGKGSQASGRPPLNRLASDKPVVSGGDEMISPLSKTQRSMTMPEEAAIDMAKTKLQKNQYGPKTQRQASDNGPIPPQLPHYVSPPISIDPDPPMATTEVDRFTRNGTDTSRNALFSPEMPNFAAISPSATEQSEDPLHRPKPAYQKLAYVDSVGFAPPRGGHPAPATAGSHEPQTDFSGFVFDLPPSDHLSRKPPMAQQASHQVHSNPVSPKSYGPYSGQYSPSPEAQNQQASRATPDQYPPRSASRQEYQQSRSLGNSQPYHAGANVQQRPYRSADPSPQYSMARQPHSTPRDAIHDYGGGVFEGAGNYEHQVPPEKRRFYPNHSQNPYPPAINSQTDTIGGSAPPNTAHPPPSRQYPPSTTASSVNPDALPAHPIPVRPGLRRQASASSAPATVERGGTPQQAAPTFNPGLAPIPSREETEPPPVTSFDLNLLVQTIKNNPHDYATMMTLVRRLVEAASVLSNEGGKADAKTTQKNRERYTMDAHKYLKKLVHKGYGDAIFYLAECHGHGSLGLPVDAKQAFHLYTSAAKGGHAQAAYRVAVCCEMGADEGGGTKRDPIKALHWYKRGASMGNTPAMYKLGIILLKGLLGQPRNPREALSWLRRAAEKADKDNPHALHELGLLYENAAPNDSIVRDEGYARQLFIQAANLGYKYSQFRLGSAFEYGLLGCAIDARHSIGWYSKAAAQAEHQAELALSGWYLTGADGILQQSDTEAYLWARKAASSGLAKAEYAMGYFTEVGIGCTASLDEAKKWYWRAASQNVPNARQRLEDLKKGGGKMQKARVSRSAMNRQNEGDCRVM